MRGVYVVYVHHDVFVVNVVYVLDVVNLVFELYNMYVEFLLRIYMMSCVR